MSSTKSLVHSATGKCIEPIGNRDNSEITLTSNCGDNTRFELTSFGSLKQIKTGSCIHPLNGAVNPKEGQLVVLYRGCDEMRLKFSFGMTDKFFAGKKMQNSPFFSIFCIILFFIW